MKWGAKMSLVSKVPDGTEPKFLDERIDFQANSLPSTCPKTWPSQLVFIKLWHIDWALGAAACVHQPQEMPHISIIVSRLAVCSGQKDFGSPLMASVWLLQLKPMSRLFDFTVAWNHGPIKGVETVKGYVRFKSQSQQKWVSGCWADNAKKGVLAFQGQGWCCLYGLSNQQPIVRVTSVGASTIIPVWIFSFKGILWWWWFLPGRLVQWYGIQSKPWNYPETGLLQDSQTCVWIHLYH